MLTATCMCWPYTYIYIIIGWLTTCILFKWSSGFWTVYYFHVFQPKRYMVRDNMNHTSNLQKTIHRLFLQTSVSNGTERNERTSKCFSIGLLGYCWQIVHVQIRHDAENILSERDVYWLWEVIKYSSHHWDET